MSFLLYIPIWLMVVIIAFLSVAIAYVGFYLIHKFYDYEHLEKYHNVTSYLFNAYGLLYAVVIAFVVYINWSDYNNAQSHVYSEANQISNLFHIVQGFDEPLRTEFMKSIYDYTEVINKQEIPDMRNGVYSYKNNDAYNKIWNDFIKLDIKTINNLPLYDKCLNELKDISDARRFRNFYMTNYIPTIIWVIMILGCFISFSFSFFFGVRARFPYFFLAIALTFTNIILLYLIYVLDHPYKGTNAISFETMEKILIHFGSVLQSPK
jgi:hypothetical protein